MTKAPTNSQSIVGAVYREDETSLRKLLASGAPIDAKDSDGRTPLMHAVLATPPNKRIVEFLLDHDANPNIHDKGQAWTALHFAARDGYSEIVKMLIQHGAQVDAVDVFGNSPLWRAAFNVPRNPTCLECLSVLLDAGSNPDLANKSGISPRGIAMDPGWEAALRLFDGK
jgi:ankyrin repeat protein